MFSLNFNIFKKTSPRHFGLPQSLLFHHVFIVCTILMDLHATLDKVFCKLFFGSSSKTLIKQACPTGAPSFFAGLFLISYTIARVWHTRGKPSTKFSRGCSHSACSLFPFLSTLFHIFLANSNFFKKKRPNHNLCSQIIHVFVCVSHLISSE